MKLKNIIFLIMLSVVLALLHGCLSINKAHNETNRSALYVFKTKDGIDEVNGFGRYEYNYKIYKSGKVGVSIEIYEKSKLLRKEFIEKSISVENNHEVIEKLELLISKDKQSNINWELQHGGEAISFTTENCISKCYSRLFSIVSVGYLDDKDKISLLEYKGIYNDKIDSKNERNNDNRISNLNERQKEVENKEKIIDNHDLVFFLNIKYEAKKDIPANK